MFEPKRKCNQCGEMKYVFAFRYGKCGECKIIAQKASDRTCYKNRRLKKMLANARGRSKRKDRPYDLDIHFDELQKRLDKGVCEVTSIPFNLDNDQGFAWDSPSLDRIDATKGYTYDNTRIVIYALNAAFGSWGEDVFRTIAEAYVRP